MLQMVQGVHSGCVQEAIKTSSDCKDKLSRSEETGLLGELDIKTQEPKSRVFQSIAYLTTLFPAAWNTESESVDISRSELSSVGGSDGEMGTS